MTLHEVVKHIQSINIGNWYNREKMPARWLEPYLKRMLRLEMGEWIFEVALPDGWWFVSVSRFVNGEYGYFIPENREQEHYLIAELERRNKK